jgi:hypothetical protein
MNDPDEPDSPDGPDGRQPMRDLLIAQALDACIAAERELSGSSEEIIARQPRWARRDLQRGVDMARSLEAVATNAVMSSEYRVSARARIMRQIGADLSTVNAESDAPSVPTDSGQAQAAAQPTSARQVRRLTAVPTQPVQTQTVLTRQLPSQIGGFHTARIAPSRRRSRWLWRGAASLLAAVLGVVATLTASASALPGEPLYSLKQVREDLEVRLAADDQARALALLRLGDARLAETARLLQLGRTGQVYETTRRYDDAVERATTSFVVGVDDALPNHSATSTEYLESKLSQQQDQLEALLKTAPEQARADLREAVLATERGRAVVAEPRPHQQAVSGSQVAAALPTQAAPLPTQTPPNPALAAPIPIQAAPIPTLPPEDRPITGAASPTPPADDDKPTAAPTQAPAIVAPTPSPMVVAANDAPPVALPVTQAAVRPVTPADPGDQNADALGNTAGPFETAGATRPARPAAGSGDDDGPPPPDLSKPDRSASVNLPPPPARSSGAQTQMASNRSTRFAPAPAPPPTAVVPDGDLETGDMVADGQTPRGLDALLMRGGAGQVISKGTEAGLRNDDVRTPTGERVTPNPTLPSSSPTLPTTTRAVATPQPVSENQPGPLANVNQKSQKDDGQAQGQGQAAAAPTQPVVARAPTVVAASAATVVAASAATAVRATNARSADADASAAVPRAAAPEARPPAIAAAVKSQAAAPVVSNAAPAKRAGVEAGPRVTNTNTNTNGDSNNSSVQKPNPAPAAPARQAAAGVGRR